MRMNRITSNYKILQVLSLLILNVAGGVAMILNFILLIVPYLILNDGSSNISNQICIALSIS